MRRVALARAPSSACGARRGRPRPAALERRRRARAGESCDALLLTPKARVIAPLARTEAGQEDFLLLTEPEFGEPVRAHLPRIRVAAKVEIEPEEHTSHVVFGGDGIPGRLRRAGGRGARRRADVERPARSSSASVSSPAPRSGGPRSTTDPACRGGTDERAVSFTKGCYPGQEPIARLHYRGHANRGLRVLELAERRRPTPSCHTGQECRPYHERRSGRDGAVALAYVRREVPEDAELPSAAPPDTLTAPRRP